MSPSGKFKAGAEQTGVHARGPRCIAEGVGQTIPSRTSPFGESIPRSTRSGKEYERPTRYEVARGHTYPRVGAVGKFVSVSFGDGGREGSADRTLYG